MSPVSQSQRLPDKALTWVAYGLLVGLAAWLRLRGLAWGAPYVYHADEHYILNAALHMVREGTPNPGFFQYPSLLLYMQASLVALLQPWLKVDLHIDPTARGLGPWDVPPEHFPFILAGRAVVAVAGIASVILLAWLWRRWFGSAAALLATGLLAVSPLHVEHSHYLTTDVPAMLWVLLALFWSAYGRDQPRALATAAVAAGLAASTKYPAGMVWLVVLVSAVSSQRPWQAVVVSFVCFVTAFALTSPYVVLDPRRAWADLSIVRHNYASGPWSPWNLWFYLSYLWHTALGPAASVLALVGMIVWWRSRSVGGGACRVAGAALPWLYVVYLSTWSVRFERNLLPVLPFALLFLGLAVARLELVVVSGRRLRAVLALLFVAVAWLPLRHSEALVERFLLPDTRTLALQWIEEHVPSGAHIAREEYTPQVSGSRHRVTFVQVLGTRPYGWFLGEGVDYIVVSSLIYERYRQVPSIFGLYEFVFALLPLVAEFQPSATVAGPTIRIYQVPRWRDDS
ncbi:MAG: glycosyltransferase family 39 protein [Candidatus Binatia bacterium]|nr:glycosyltransferase family 39 protein [Candidatus Binatia bacterium]